MNDVPATLRYRPSVHQLCLGAFIQEPLHIRSSISVYPLKPIGFDVEASYTARYANEIVGAAIEDKMLDELRAQGKHARPVIALAVKHKIDAPPGQLERVATPLLAHARSVISWVAGEIPVPFAMVTSTTKETFFRMIPPRSRRRHRLGFGNTGPDYYSLLNRLMTAVERDERFAFALSLFREALREEHAEFRVARFFACLEALAYRLKARVGSRQAVRLLLGLERGAMASVKIDGVDYRYDRVEIGGRIRDKLFHGVPFDASELTHEAEIAYQHLQEHPTRLRDLLLVDCELEFARWANGKSRGQQEI